MDFLNEWGGRLAPLAFLATVGIGGTAIGLWELAKTLRGRQ